MYWHTKIGKKTSINCCLGREIGGSKPRYHDLFTINIIHLWSYMKHYAAQFALLKSQARQKKCRPKWKNLKRGFEKSSLLISFGSFFPGPTQQIRWTKIEYKPIQFTTLALAEIPYLSETVDVPTTISQRYVIVHSNLGFYSTVPTGANVFLKLM